MNWKGHSRSTALFQLLPIVTEEIREITDNVVYVSARFDPDTSWMHVGSIIFELTCTILSSVWSNYFVMSTCRVTGRSGRGEGKRVGQDLQGLYKNWRTWSDTKLFILSEGLRSSLNKNSYDNWITTYQLYLFTRGAISELDWSRCSWYYHMHAPDNHRACFISSQEEVNKLFIQKLVNVL